MKGNGLKIAGFTLVIMLVLSAMTFIGSQLVSAQNQTAVTDPGLVVVEVVKGGPADTAGLKRGDIVLKANSTDTNTLADLTTAIKGLKVGDLVKLTVMHGDQQKELSITLGDKNGKPYLGFTPWGAKAVGLNKIADGKLLAGALITSVEADSPAAKAGLVKGDRILAVNGKDLSADYDLAAAITALKTGDSVKLKVASGVKAEEKELTAVLGEKDGKAYLGVQYISVGAMKSANGGELLPAPKLDGQGGRGFILPKNAQSGVVIVEVVAGGPAEKAGLKVNDVVTLVDGKVFSQAQGFVDAISAKKPGDTVTLTIAQLKNTETKEIKVTLGANPTDAAKAYLGVKISAMFQFRLNNDGGQQQNPANPNQGGFAPRQVPADPSVKS